MKLPSLLKQTSNNRFNIMVSVCLILAFVIRFCITLKRNFVSASSLNTYGYSEFLINFQGGFVRRGLLGEGLYQIYSLVSYPMRPVLSIICYLFFTFVLAFFFHQFRRHRYCWWILLSPLFLGYTYDIVRKDYMLYCILIGCLYLMRNASLTVSKRLWSCLLITLGLFLHEAFIFWGFPVYALLLLSCHKNSVINCILVFVPIVSFVILSIYKGTADTAHAIVDSWNSLLPGAPLVDKTQNSIGALGWNSINTFLSHLKRNFNSSSAGLLPIYAFGAYYMFTNFFLVFGHKSDTKIDNEKLTLSLLYSSVLLCLIPMFTILSCDTGRVFQYASVAAFSTLLIIPHNIVISAFPKWYVYAVQRFNTLILHFLPPSKGLIILLLLFIGMSPYYFSIQTCWGHSVIGTICEAVIRVIKLSICLIH